MGADVNLPVHIHPLEELGGLLTVRRPARTMPSALRANGST